MKKIIIFLLFITGTCHAQTITKWKVFFPSKTVEFTQQSKAVAYCNGNCDSITKVVFDITQTEQYKDSLNAIDNNFALATIIQNAKSAEGVAYNQLTAAQVRSLFAITLFKEGAINSKTLTINKLKEWVK